VIQEGSIEVITTLFAYDNCDADIQFNNPYGCYNKHEDYDGDTNTHGIGKGVESQTEICYNMIYQLERVNATIDGTTIINCELDVRYVLTEVIVVRNSFACQLNALSQSFSPSNLPYSYGDEQQWPYGLDATGLSPHETLAVLQFWSLSACSAAGTSNLVKRFIETLRRRETANQANQTNQTNQTQQSQTQQSQLSQQVSRKNSHESRQLQPQQSNDRIYHTQSAQTNDAKNSSGPNCPNTDPTADSIADTQKPNTNTKEDRDDQNENNGTETTSGKTKTTITRLAQ